MKKMTKGRGALAGVCVLCLAFAALKVLPGSSERAVRPLADIENALFQQQVEEMGAAYAADARVRLFWGDAYQASFENLLGEETKAACVPYLVCTVGDVETAGTTDWSVRLETVSAAGREPRENAVQLKNARLTVTADANTALTQADGGSTYQTDGTETALGASTRESGKNPNAACTVSVRAEGTLTVRAGLLTREMAKIDFTAEVPYRNNVT